MELELCWNAFGEVDNLKGGLGTPVPAQKNPDVLSLQGNVRFSRETIGYVPLRESKIVAPSEMFIVGDRPGFFVEVGRIGEGGVGGRTIYLDFLSRRHRKKTNITFMDGHAESFRAEHIFLPTKEAFRRWNQTDESIKNGSMPIYIAVESCVPGRRRKKAGHHSFVVHY